MIKEWLLPSDWLWKNLEDICADTQHPIVDGPFGSNLKTSDYVSDGIPVLQGKNITGDKFSWNEIRFISAEKAEELKRSTVRVGDFLLIKIGSIGYSAEIKNLHGYDHAIIPANMAKATIDRQKVFPEFFAQWMKSIFVKRHLSSVASKTAQPALSLHKIKNIPIPVPPIEEQRRIAAILDKADAIRRKREQALAIADDFLRATFLDMFGDQDWGSSPLAKVVSDGTLVTYGIVQAGPEVPNGVPYIRTGDIQNGIIITSSLRHTSPEIESKFERSRVKAGEIVMSIRATVGTTAIVPPGLDGANLTQGTARISPGQHVTKEYLLNYIRSHKCQSWIQKQVKGATFREITLTRLREMGIPLPPMRLQTKFSNISKKIENLCDLNAYNFDEADILFRSLSQRAFRGEL